MEAIHNLLRRQLKKYFGETYIIPVEYEGLLCAIDDAYKEFDIDRKMLERSLELSSNELLQANSEMQAIFQAIPDLLFRIDKEGKILEFKAGNYDDCFAKPQTLFGKYIQNTPSKEIGLIFQEAINKFNRTKDTVIFEYAFRKENRERFYEARLLPFSGEEVIIIVRNITQRVQTEEELINHREHLEELVDVRTEELRASEENLLNAKNIAEAANKTKSQFLAKMSHELRTPMNGIIGISNMMAKYNNQNLTEKQLEGLKVIHQSGNRLLDLINDLLDISKIEAGKMPVTLAPLSIDKLFYNLRAIVTNLTKSKDLTFIISKNEHVNDIIISDEKKLHQILMNLLGNAVKFTDKGKVVLRVHNLKEELCFEVADEGIGISKENINEVFDEFKQVDSSETRKYQGTGLGLAICKKLIALLNGRIEIQSELNVGTQVQFYIPYIPVDVNKKEKIEDPKSIVETGTPKKILIMEDEKLAMHVLKEFLSGQNYQLTITEDGESACKQALTFNPDLIMLDLDSPKMTGIEVLKSLREKPRFSKTPVILMSINEADGVATFLNNDVHFIRKPISEGELVFTINQMLRLNSKAIYPILLLDIRRELLSLERELTKAQLPTFIVFDNTYFLYEIEYNKSKLIVINKHPDDDFSILDISRFIRKQSEPTLKNGLVIIIASKNDYNHIKESVEHPRTLWIERNKYSNILDLSAEIIKIYTYNWRRKKVLVAEDEEVGVYTIKLMLEDRFDLIIARNGSETLTKYFEEKPDIVLLDIMMPELNGFQVYDIIKNKRHAPEMKIIALTARAMSEERQEILDYGFDDYISKPIEEEILIEKLNLYLGVNKNDQT